MLIVHLTYKMIVLLINFIPSIKFLDTKNFVRLN